MKKKKRQILIPPLTQLKLKGSQKPKLLNQRNKIQKFTQLLIQSKPKRNQRLRVQWTVKIQLQDLVARTS